MNWENAILLFITLIISLTVHEAGHAFVAMLGGDRTAYQAGQVTLNPLPHIRREPFGTVVLPLLALLSTNGQGCIGYAHAPYDPYWAARNPRKAALMSLAGPACNVLLAAVAFVILYVIARPDGDTERAVRDIAGAFLRLNLLLAVFNLIPLPPLDGAGVVGGLFPPSKRWFDQIAAIPYSAIVVFVILSRFIYELFDPIFYAVNRWLPYPLYY